MIKKSKKSIVVSTRLDIKTYDKLKKLKVDISKTLRAYLEEIVEKSN